MSKNINTKNIKKIKICEIVGMGLPFVYDNIDTDRIIPAKFLKEPTFSSLAGKAFYDERYNYDGSQKEHPFNDKRFSKATILIVGNNFGCGSSREHAAHALKLSGIKAIIGKSFAQIFQQNCFSIGLPTIAANQMSVDAINEYVLNNPNEKIKISLLRKEILYGKSDKKIPIKFDMPENQRKAFLEGKWNMLYELLEVETLIEEKCKNIRYTSLFFDIFQK